MNRLIKYLYIASCVAIIISFLSACVVLCYFTIGTVRAGGSLPISLFGFWIYNYNFWYLLFSLTLIYFLRFRYGFFILALYLSNISMFYRVFNNLGYTDYEFFNRTSALVGLLMLIFGFVYYVLLWHKWLKLRELS